MWFLNTRSEIYYDFFDFFLLSVSVFQKSLFMEKPWKLKKSQSPHAQKLLSPTENSAPERLIGSHAFNSATLWHHATSQSHRFA